jgi:hypothetical protein
VHRGRECRLGRLAAPARHTEISVAHHRCALRARAAIGAAVRNCLVHAGIDPARAVMLLVADEAEAELAAIPDTPELERADAAVAAGAADSDPDAVSRFRTKMHDLVRRYREGDEIDPARASLAELHAWCLAAANGPELDP